MMFNLFIWILIWIPLIKGYYFYEDIIKMMLKKDISHQLIMQEEQKDHKL